MRKINKLDKRARAKYKAHKRKKYHRFYGFDFDDLENIIDTMPTNEQTALALGFYNYGDSIADELENGEFDDFVDYVDDDFESFDDDEDDGFMIEGDDEFMIEGDDEFDNVITDGDDWIGMGDEDFLNAHHSKRKIRGGGKDAFKLRGSHHINFNEDGEVLLEGGDD